MSRPREARSVATSTLAEPLLNGGLKADEIGRIDVKDRYAYVAIKREKLKQVLRQTQGEKIKGIRTVIEPVR